LPHGVASDKRIEDGDLVVVDWGCVYKGYCSDLTRTIIVGNADAKAMEVLNVVLEAHRLAAEAEEFTFGSDLDAIARDYITSKGLVNTLVMGWAMVLDFRSMSTLRFLPGHSISS